MNQSLLTKECIFRKFSHFKAFLYFYMAFADDYLDDKEADMIRLKIKDDLIEEESVDTLFDEVQATYEQTPPAQMSEVIQLNFQNFKKESQEHKYTLFTDLYDVMIADGVVHYKENESLDKLKKLVNTYLL